MGITDVATSVTPKFGLLAPVRDGGTVAVRYFMPWKTHPTMAVAGGNAWRPACSRRAAWPTGSCQPPPTALPC